MNEVSKATRGILLASRKGYKVTECGDVWSPHMKKLKLQNIGGYLCFRVGGKPKEQFVVKAHRLMAFQKFGDSIFQKGICVRHLNGVSTDNSYENIAIGTQSDNIMDIPEFVRKRKSSMANRIHSDELVRSIIEMHKNGHGYRAIRAKTGLPKSTLSFYLSKTAKIRSWSLQHLSSL